MSSQLQKTLSSDGLSQILLIDAKDVLQESLERLQAWPPSMIHLGQALMGAALFKALLSKEEESKVALQWSVKGPFGELYAEAKPMGELRGTILKPQAPVNNMYARLGKGLLQVRRTEKDTSTGLVEAEGDVCLDLLTYLQQSEQRRCAMNLWVDLAWDESRNGHPVYVRKALGYLVELLPNFKGQIETSRIEEWERYLKSLGKLSRWEINPQTPLDSILHFLHPGDEAKTLLYQSLKFSCSCSEERAQRALTLALNQDGSHPRQNSEVLRCEFCGKVYDL